MLHKFNQQKHLNYLESLPKIGISAENVTILNSPQCYRESLLQHIHQARCRIYIVALYLEQDDAGQALLTAIYQAKQANPKLDVAIFVDWHRAQRGRIGDKTAYTNADWYRAVNTQYPGIIVPIYGVPINTREALGVLHQKGYIIDDTVIYSGASINDVYLQQHDKYRYDRYHVIHSKVLADSMVDYIKNNLTNTPAVIMLNEATFAPAKTEHKKQIQRFRQHLKGQQYQFSANTTNDELAIAPLIGLGKTSSVNNAIVHLLGTVKNKLVICTPYFNLPLSLKKVITRLLKHGKQVEIIIGDKIANDFYIPESEPFRIISAIPYLYETNLRKFVHKYQRYIDKGNLTIRLWRDGDNTYHVKGIWVDDEWIFVTGNNLNPRAMHLDLENGLLIHDPKHELTHLISQELSDIQHHTQVISHYKQLESERYYPVKVRNLLRRLRRIGLSKIISRIL